MIKVKVPVHPNNKVKVISLYKRTKKKERMWAIKCLCKKYFYKPAYRIKEGRICLSCARKGVALSHGQSNSDTYISWCAMKTRCNNINHKHYRNYGGRGISYCKEWESFENFLRDMGERPQGKTLDKIDNNKDYGPNNCRWITPKEQANNRRNNKAI